MNEKSNATKAVEALGTHVNSFSTNHKEFANGIRKEHRTIQQSIMKTFLVLIDGWADDFDNERYDARNEATVKLAKELSAIANKTYIPYI